VGIRPDYKIEVRDDLLNEADGPTLLYAIQGLHGGRIVLPRHAHLYPAPGLLEIQYERFRRAG
jgi:putative restriction endonuclease